ncbi:TolB family protein [Kineococcus sp. SYSU DK002]|uniref:TolB family protein n=1 Tax=Kineococcus sp. SYSU DK002 TaxID=3383123 RepID=UPI003D7CC9EB
MRTIVGTLGVAVLTAGLVTTAPAASAATATGPLLAYPGVSADRVEGLDAVDTATGRQWRIADGAPYDASWSPDGGRIAWISYGGDDLGRAHVAAADGSQRRDLDPDGDSRSLAWGPDGTLAWFHRPDWAPADCTTDDRLVRPDLVLEAPDGTRRTAGTVAPTAGDLTFSPDGATVAWRERGADVCAASPAQLVVADVATGRQQVVAGAQDTAGLSFSSDSSTVVLTRPTPEGGDLVLVDVASRAARQVVTPGAGEGFAAALPGGESVAVVRTTPTERRLVVVDRAGAVVRDLADPPEFVEQVLASGDGVSVVVAGRSLPSADGAFQDTQVWRQPLDGSAATLLSSTGRAGTFEAAVTARVSNAPVVERRERGLRQ